MIKRVQVFNTLSYDSVTTLQHTPQKVGFWSTNIHTIYTYIHTYVYTYKYLGAKSRKNKPVFQKSRPLINPSLSIVRKKESLRAFLLSFTFSFIPNLCSYQSLPCATHNIEMHFLVCITGTHKYQWYYPSSTSLKLRD